MTTNTTATTYGIPGYEYGHDHNKPAQDEAWERVNALGLKRRTFIHRTEYDYNCTHVTLDISLLDMLSPLERAVFANHGPLPFGGSVTDNVVSINGND